MSHSPSENRYQDMVYRRCGKSGLKLPGVSLGLWQNFGEMDIFSNSRQMVLRAFDLGITHFDLANNYGPPPGSAEDTFGKILKTDLAAYRDEMIISTKAGYYMWPGPYGDRGSRKYLLASLDQSLKRMGIEYVDIFYHHRPDPETPLLESMQALDTAVRQGKALYVGISSYNPEQTREALDILDQLGTPCLIHQPSYSMLNRWIEDGLTDLLAERGVGCIAFSPLAQGRLTDRYLNGIPEDSRIAKAHGNGALLKNSLTPELLAKITELNEIAKSRGQSLAQMALSWVLRSDVVTSVLIGASRVQQIEDNIEALKKTTFTEEEIARIDGILAD